MWASAATLVTATARSAARFIVIRVVFGLLISEDSLADYFLSDGAEPGDRQWWGHNFSPHWECVGTFNTGRLPLVESNLTQSEARPLSRRRNNRQCRSAHSINRCNIKAPLLHFFVVFSGIAVA
jgi:hypothetical protein